MLVVDYFAYVARSGASARRAARRRLLRLRRTARHRLLRLHRASGCLGMSHDSSCGLSSTTSPRASSSSTNSPTSRVRVPRHVALLVVDYFAYIVCPGASARCADRRAACHRLLCLRRAFGCLGTSRGRRRLLRLHRASGCLGTSRGSSSTSLPHAGSSSTTLPTSRG
jgi:hypothetical protein